MISPVKAALRASHDATRAIRGEAIWYMRGDDIRIRVAQATRGSTAWDRSAPFNGVRVGDRSTDWLIEASLLRTRSVGSLYFNAPLIPERGDVIQSAEGTFRVMPFGEGSQLWQWHGRDRTVYRIHTKERD
jgi:hypothetical protein